MNRFYDVSIDSDGDLKLRKSYGKALFWFFSDCKIKELSNTDMISIATNPTNLLLYIAKEYSAITVNSKIDEIKTHIREIL